MFKGFNIHSELLKQKMELSEPDDFVIEAVNDILAKSLFEEKTILNNLKSYNKSFEMLNQYDLDKSLLFKTDELREFCIKFRLKFLESQFYKFDVPYEAILKIKFLNQTHGKNLEGFKIMGVAESFKKKLPHSNFALFAPTTMGNYYLVHQWGEDLSWSKKIMAFPLRNFERLAVTVICAVFLITISLPTIVVTSVPNTDHWCRERIAVFFHLLIFFGGVSAYILVGFNKRFSGTIWDEPAEYI
jgi:hypothetical protein